MKTWNLIFAVLLLALSIVHGAVSSTSPVLQLTGYQLMPETVYPGTTGQLELTIENTGTETAKSTTIYYTYGLDQDWSIYLGDIGQSSEAITTIPFEVPEKVSSGIFVINVDIYYLDEDETSSKHAMASIPLEVSQHKVLEARTLSISSETIGRGETLSVVLDLENTGGVMKNLIITAADNSSFSLAGTTQKRVGDIAANAGKNITVDIVSSSSAEEGKYSIPLVLTYQDALQNTVSQTVYVGPVTVSGSSSQLRIQCTPVSKSEIGSVLTYNLTVQNRGSGTQSAVISVEGTDVLTPIGINTFYLDSIPPGGERSELIRIGIDAGSTSGYYALPITMRTSGEEQEYEAGIIVQATPEILLTPVTEEDSAGTQVTIKISNTGNTAIRSLYIRAEPTEYYGISGASEKFIGTLSVDDYASFSVTLSRLRADAAGDSGGLPVVVVFKDNDNVEHTVRETVAVSKASSAGFGLSASESSGTPTTQRSMGGGPMNGGGQLNIPLYAGVGLVILSALFIGYKKLRGKKKKSPEGFDEARR
jgi:hypothetical protein